MAIRPRSAWNARAPRAVTHRALSYWEGIRVHHSGGNASSSVRAIQNWDMDQKGMDDIGYSFVIRDGEVWEGRGFNAHPAHDSLNVTLGICIIGTYSSRLPNAADLDALVWFIQEARRKVGRNLPVDGHRDARPNVTGTVCPGDRLHAHLPTIRRRAEEEDMPITTEDADKIANAVWNRDNPTLGLAYGAMLRYNLNAVRPDRQQTEGARLGFLRDLDRLAAGQEALLAAVSGQDVVAAVRAELDRQTDELTEALDRAAVERAELAELVRQAAAGELAADEVVQLIGERLLAGEPAGDET